MKKPKFNRFTDLNAAAEYALAAKDIGALETILGSAAQHHQSDMHLQRCGLGGFTFFKQDSYAQFLLGLSTSTVSIPGAEEFFQKVTGAWHDERMRLERPRMMAGARELAREVSARIKTRPRLKGF